MVAQVTLVVLAVAVSAVLYRIPRGGPERVWWDQRGLGAIAQFNEEIWSIGTAAMLAVAFGNPLLLALALPLWLGERPGYMHWVTATPSQPILSGVKWTVEVRQWPMNLRGLLLLNPALGSIYKFWSNRKVPIWHPYMDGWTAYAELTSGFVTATSYAGVAWALSTMF